MTMNGRLLPAAAWGLGALLLAGCAVGPRYTAPADAPVTISAPERSLFASDAVQRDWWRQLDDAELDALIERALGNNHDIRIAQARLQEARATQAEAERDRLPAVTMGASKTRGIAQGNGMPADARTLAQSSRAGFDAAWEIDLFGRLQRLDEAATARAQASAADLEQVRIVAVAELARSYYEMRGAEQRIAVTRRTLDSLRNSLRVTEAQVQTGRGLEGDLASAQANLASTESQLPALETTRRQAAYRVAVLAGLRPAELEPMLQPQQLRVLDKRLPIGDLGDLLRRRPDVLRAERGLAASTADVGAATAELYPRFDIGGFLGFVALRGADVGSSSSRAFSVKPGVSWPALRLGSVKARVRGAEARAEGERARYEQTVLRAIEDVEGALAGYGQNQLRLRRLAEASERSGRAAELAEVRYREGAAPYLSMLDAQRTLLRAQDAVAEAETASYTSLVALYKALGGGWQAPPDRKGGPGT
ncbi:MULTISPECIES: TolC family protein [unclassified Variovorax]|uniref:efflux transporter outer membrane subunit n=1 Tax=unclassified Variovorax TaxID=663243 RepID=UPI002577E85D|nr:MULTISPECIES: TolC family protein [unclassified Variovorax]MDM0086644.1 TolC family protein [Variovorax sp. J22G40]MDM0145100.1 TolC family protein [Variovorax sp. J2P1-31]